MALIEMRKGCVRLRCMLIGVVAIPVFAAAAPGDASGRFVFGERTYSVTETRLCKPRSIGPAETDMELIVRGQAADGKRARLFFQMRRTSAVLAVSRVVDYAGPEGAYSNDGDAVIEPDDARVKGHAAVLNEETDQSGMLRFDVAVPVTAQDCS